MFVLLLWPSPIALEISPCFLLVVDLTLSGTGVRWLVGQLQPTGSIFSDAAGNACPTFLILEASLRIFLK